ncbi:hypothetical protein CS543_05845 [Porphyromonas gingivalis]|nr:hypothetical protein CS543_05845 [Porphyromonas gingivalis]OWR83123.1 hypothetical protein SJDPG12_10135 [Porphyromonas gingivalis SJD12]
MTVGEVKKTVIMSKHLADSERLHIVEEYLGSLAASMTGDPLHNALAERMNNTIKNSWYISSEEQSFQEAKHSVE